MSEDTEPKCIEATVSASIGATVQIVKFEYTEKFNYVETRRYSIPEDWSEEDVQEFTVEKTKEVYDIINEVHANPTVKRLMEQRDELNS